MNLYINYKMIGKQLFTQFLYGRDKTKKINNSFTFRSASHIKCFIVIIPFLGVIFSLWGRMIITLVRVFIISIEFQSFFPLLQL
jgi:hypothetical protein